MKKYAYKLERRVTIPYNIRLDGISDILQRARGRSVLDIGCNRGMVGYEFMLNGAIRVHGVDHYEMGIKVAQEVFADVQDVDSRFVRADLSVGRKSMATLDPKYDIVLVLAVYHKLRRQMPLPLLLDLLKDFAERTTHFLVWSGKTEWLGEVTPVLEGEGLTRVHSSHLSHPLDEINTIWQRMTE